ncbi:uncharacterized protein PpBr36_11208, partial [Pyricularia pennisetigena]|uniref:uncharacterized protein n=1 Tax=Pyricularia pennisetigena TaxID=1578925 RepID=UPI0011532884
VDTDSSTQQYPPLFHSATNLPSFIKTFWSLSNAIRCPERYRRGIVDYALISPRISIERAPLDKLNNLTVSSVHPSAFIYLSSGRRFAFGIFQIYLFFSCSG